MAINKGKRKNLITKIIYFHKLIITHTHIVHRWALSIEWATVYNLSIHVEHCELCVLCADGARIFSLNSTNHEYYDWLNGRKRYDTLERRLAVMWMWSVQNVMHPFHFNDEWYVGRRQICIYRIFYPFFPNKTYMNICSVHLRNFFLLRLHSNSYTCIRLAGSK